LSERVKIRVDHQAGQYRAELFEILIFHLLKAAFTNSVVVHGLVLPRSKEEPRPSLSLDFAIFDGPRITAIVETKSPYTDSASFGINKTFRRVKDAFLRFPAAIKPAQIIVAIASELPAASARESSAAQDFFRQFDVDLKVWDAKKLTQLIAKHLNLTIHSFSIQNLKKALRAIDPDAVAESDAPPEQGEGGLPSTKTSAGGDRSPKSGEHDDVVVLCADFCSYTKFVLASGGDRELISSVMGRFYRETRRIIEDAGGYIDKYMGDGILAFWMPSPISGAELGKKIEDCASRLITSALGIAKEWQDQIDHSVEITGMRVGAAVGKVLFIPEIPGRDQPMHAISDYINLAARLQSAAKENSLVISNRLRKTCFDSDGSFQELEPLELKNFGKVVAWAKDYEKG